MKILFRCDGGPVRGSGHLMRCLALADELARDGCAVSFACSADSAPFLDRVRQRNFRLFILDQAAEPAAAEDIWDEERQKRDAAFISGESFDWAVVDHYALDAAWERQARVFARRILVIDDLANRPHACDVLLDQNEYGDKDTRYSRLISPGAKTLLGAHYALLRPEFAAARANLRPVAERATNILILMGGSDYRGLTLRIIEAIRPALPPRAVVNAVIGRQNPFRAQIEAAAQADPRLRPLFDPPSISALMREADIAFGAGGTATWEFACLGVPALIVSFADNQIRLAQDAALAGINRYIGHFDKVDKGLIEKDFRVLAGDSIARRRLRETAMNLVDGLGVERVKNLVMAHGK